MPAAGKTTLAHGLGRALHLPVVIRDDIKTGIADTWVGTDWSDPAVRTRLSSKAFDEFHRLVHGHLDGGSGLVAEAAWHWEVAPRRLAPIFARCRPVVVHVAVDPALSAARYRARSTTGERHPAHQDERYADEMDQPGYDWRRYTPPRDLAARIVTVDGALAPEVVLATVLDAL